MKLSVLMITYNHERYLREALDGALMQDADFDFEIVVGEDGSKDATRQILREYADRFPGKIRPLFREKNLGAVRNFFDTLGQCRGQYVALLEGDDLWTDARKLRKQVDYLDAHPACVGCFHNVTVRCEGGSNPAYSSNGSNPEYPYVRAEHKGTSELESLGTLSMEELLRVNVIPTCASVFRRGLIEPLPAWLFELKMGDYPLHLLLAQHGTFGYLDEIMGVYRVHGAGLWTTMGKLTQLKAELSLFEILPKALLPRFRPAARRALSARLWNAAIACDEAGERAAARRYLVRSILNGSRHVRPRLRTKLKRLARLCTPAGAGQGRSEPSASPPATAAIGPAPRVSFVVPAYNAERYLVESVQSILAQTYRDFECIVVDDGSTDRTPAFLAELARRDARVRPLRVPHGGIVEALNAGVREARGELIARMDADDICVPERLEKQVRYLDEHADFVAVGSTVTLVDPFASTLWEIAVKPDHAGIEAELLRGNGWALFHPTALIRKGALAAVGGYRPEYQWSEDIDLFLRLAEVGKLANLQEPLLRYRQHFSSVNRTKLEVQRGRTERLLAEAFARRGLAAPARFEIDLGPQISRYDQVRAWAKRALITRNLRVARRHALAALRSEPLRYDSWSLAYHALTGR